VTLTWNAVAGATGYNVYWSTTAGVTTANGTEITGSRNPRWKQTSANKTAAELRAAPEYFNQGAYSLLFAASYPFTLPYSAGLDELRTYLQQLKLPLWQLREALLPLSGATVAAQADVAAERLQLPPHAEDLIANSNFVPAAVAWNTPHPETELAPVDAFLQAASLTYESLLELLEVSWVQGGQRVVIEGVNDSCDTATQHLAPMSLPFLDRAHRFLRLWLAAGFKMWELDLLLNAPGIANGTLDEAALVAINSFRRLQDATKLEVDEQLAFYQDIDVATHRDPDGATTTSLYARVFLNTAVTSVAPDADLALIATGGAVTDPLLTEHMPGIQAALGVGAGEADTLIGLTDGHLTLANLSLMYRVCALAAAAHLSIGKLLVVAELLDPGAGGPQAALMPLFASPAETRRFLKQVGSLGKSPVSLDAATYLLTAPAVTTLTAPITAAQTTISVAGVTGFPLANFRVSIGPEELLVTAVSGAGNTEWTVVRGQLGTVAAAAASGATVELVGGWSTTTQMTEANVVTALEAVRQAIASLVSTSTTVAAPIAASDTAIKVASDTGFPPPPFSVTIGVEIVLVTAVGGTGNTEWTVTRAQQGTTAAPANTGAVIAPTGGDVNGAAIAAVAANARPTGAAGVENKAAALILEHLDVPGTSTTLLEALTDPAFTSSTGSIARGTSRPQFTAIQLFDKVGVLVRALRLVASELDWLLTNAAVYGGLDLTSLPATTGQPAVSLERLLPTLLLVALARSWLAAPASSGVQTLYDLIGAVSTGSLADAQAAQAALAAITGWPLTDVASFAESLAMTFPADYTAPSSYEALRTLETMALTAHATAPQLADWGAVPADEANAEGAAAGALGVIKSQHLSEEAWLELAAGLMNPIRERRSAAVQAYLISERDSTGKLIYGDADSLFDHFLIDVQMSSCEPTSRVVQAYIAVQIFVERCILDLEAPEVSVDPAKDGAWNEWSWMSRYRVWEANREVFLYPENWLIESQRPDRTEIYKTLEQEVHQGQSTDEYLATVVLNYIERLEGVAHLVVTGTCEDPNTGDIHVIARTPSEPPAFYHRSLADGKWAGWVKIPLDIRTHQVVPAIYRDRLCLFWLEVKISNEPSQTLPAAQQSSQAPPQVVDRYVSLAVHFSTFTNGSWAPAQVARGPLYDKPFYGETAASDARATEALYTIKVQAPVPSPGTGADLLIDVFRRGEFQVAEIEILGIKLGIELITGVDETVAVHLGRVVFDGRFSDVELRDVKVPTAEALGSAYLAVPLLEHAQATYGPEAQPLLPLVSPDPDLNSDSSLAPAAGALVSGPSDPSGGSSQTLALDFTAVGLEQQTGTLLNTAPIPLRVVGPDSDLNFEPTSYFFFQDNRRCYWVQSTKYYWTGSAWAPITPSYPSTAPFELRYVFHVFYHPFTGLFWKQLAGGGFDRLYDVNLQQNPDQVDPSVADVFAFEAAYQPDKARVWWDHDDVTGQDRQFLDFRPGAAYAVYNWELFYHIPLYVAQLLSQNHQFEDARSWFHHVFNPTRQGLETAPQRFWIPKPLHNLTTAEILKEQINNLLEEVNRGDAAAVAAVQQWREHPFNPFAIADLRPVAYMKSTVMSYLDNLIAWGDSLFSTESREALSEATLLYVIASEILGPQPAAITPPMHADESFDQLEPALDAFANAMVEIENVIGGAGGGGAGGGSGDGVPRPHTFYFKIPSNAKLLGYWTTVADRLYKLRHCQNIAGAPLELALFDAPIDPGLLVAAQAAGLDVSSVLSEITAALPNYRFTSLYPQALDFVNAVRAYGASFQAALEKADAGALTILQQTQQQQLLNDGSQILEWQVQQAEQNKAAAEQGLTLAQQKHSFNSSQSYMNFGEAIDATISAAFILNYAIVAAGEWFGSLAALIPQFEFGAAGFGGSPTAIASLGGKDYHASATAGANVGKAVAAALDKTAMLAAKQGGYERRMDTWNEAAREAQIQITQSEAQIKGTEFALQIAEQNQTVHQEQIEDLEKQINFLSEKFTSNSLYDWMVGSLATTYFQSYQLAYQMCKQLERCYQFELGTKDTSFIRFGYWDSLYKGLLAGETLNQDLRRMQASYLQQNERRYELSRFVSLGLLDPTALQALLVSGECHFELPESLFDNDYRGHYNRRLTRVSVTVVYPTPGKFDNVKATLTLVANRVRVSTDTSAGYPEGSEGAPGADPRFVYNYAAVPQKIALGNAQDDPGLFVTTIASNITDQRYLPFENAGAVSSWHLELPEATNEIDLTTVGDVILHLYYTALDGGEGLQQTVEQYNSEQRPTSGVKVFSALNDFPTPPATVSEPHPIAPWQAFLEKVNAPANQTLTLNILPTRLPAWTRGKTISVTSLTLLALAWSPGEFVLVPQAPLPIAPLTMTPVAGVTEPNVCSATITLPANTPLEKWSFEMQQKGAADFRSLTPNEVGDVLLLMNYSVS
jgi:hypothetical protein